MTTEEIKSAIEEAENIKGSIKYYEKDKPEYIQAIETLVVLAEQVLEAKEPIDINTAEKECVKFFGYRIEEIRKFIDFAHSKEFSPLTKSELTKIISESSLWTEGKNSHQALSELVESIWERIKS